jgi:hypothetical protein
MHPCGDLRDSRNRQQIPFLMMVQPPDHEQSRDDCGGAQQSPFTPPSKSIWIDKSIWNAGAETEIVTVLERLRPANPPAIEKRAAGRFEIRDIVAATGVTDDCVAVGDARIRDLQAEPRRAADDRLVAPEYQQPRTRRIAIHREQTRSLRSPQHCRLLRYALLIIHR